MDTSPYVLAVFNLGMPEILIIFGIIILLFGAKRLPELARGFGKAIREFKKATNEIEDDIRTAIEDEPKPTESKKIQHSVKNSESTSV